MKKIILLLLLSSCLLATANAQVPYVVTTFTQPYTTLTDSTSINNNAIWSDTSSLIVPLGFNFSLMKRVTDTLFFGGAGFASDNLSGPGTPPCSAVFNIMEKILTDRGNTRGDSSLSPITLHVSGTTGNHIAKLQFTNTGFRLENPTYSHWFDLQIWLYEASGVMEYHFGPSNCYASGISPKVKLASSCIAASSAIFELHQIAGNMVITDSVYVGDLPPYPADGTVWRFTPIPEGVGTLNNVNTIFIYPNPANDQIHMSIGNRYTDDLYGSINEIEGRTIKQFSLHKGLNTVSIHDLPAGLYFVKLYSDGIPIATQKLMKQ